MNSLRIFFCLAAVAFCAAPAGAQTMKPGLWESTSKMGGSPELNKAMAQMQQQMANMPPEQRKQMESMMGKSGIGMGAGGMTVKMCLTQEMIDRGQVQRQQQGNCKTTITEKTSQSMKMNFSCTDPVSSGEAVYTFQGDKAYTMTMRIATAAKGAASATSIDSSGKWLGSDCGEVKPIALPKP